MKHTHVYAAVFLGLMLIGLGCAFAQTNTNSSDIVFSGDIMKITINGTTLDVQLVDNSSARALTELLADGPLAISMTAYGNFEQYGRLGKTLPRNDENITTQAGDVILYQGSMIALYYAPNTWNFTRLGKIRNATAAELKQLLGGANVTATFSLD